MPSKFMFTILYNFHRIVNHLLTKNRATKACSTGGYDTLMYNEFEAYLFSSCQRGTGIFEDKLVQARTGFSKYEQL